MAELFIGGQVDAAEHKRTGQPVTLGSSDFTTHGVIVGMTGSGKTGLGIVLIEEVLAAGIPVLMIDPKGDLTNLLLTFPQLRPEDFRPWINEGDATRAGVTADEFAAQQAELWAKGLGDWDYGKENIAKLRETAEFTIYTPGSTAGAPLNIVGSLHAPADPSDIETMRDEVDGYVSGLLGLVGIEADPMSSREHILLANLIETSWIAGRSLDLATLVAQVADPPLRKLGVFELDLFFPPKERMAFAMKLNGLLASPAFAAWGQGPPLDIGALLERDGKPCAAVITTAHLSDEERQFVTALVLAKVVTWMRQQPGTTDLRALVYMDEVAGYVPPTAMPPTKRPIMTLMKQARAFGVGVVLATQNPVDVDYKALSNAGTWMVGRLQTERDKARLLDGMSAAAGGVDVAAVGDTISGLAKREFVLRRAGKDAPEVITTRWAMSYLRGPLTKTQIETLMADEPEGATAAAPAAAPAGPSPEASPATSTASTSEGAPTTATADDESPVRPEVASGIPVTYLDPAAAWATTVGAVPGGTRLAPAAIARVRLLYDDSAADLRHTEEWEAVLHPLSATPDPSEAIAVDYDDRDLRSEAPTGVRYVLPVAPVADKSYWSGLQKALVDHLVTNRAVEVFRNPGLKLWSRAGETQAAFAARCREAAAAGTDAAAAKLRDKYEPKVKRAQDAIAKATDRVEVAETQAQGRRNEEILSTAGGLLGSILGGRSRVSDVLGKLGSSAGRRSRTATAGRRADAARNRVEEAHDQLADLESELADDLAEIERAWSAKAAAIEPVAVPLERTDVSVISLGLVWIPT